jgi:uncharacterized membrane protein
MLCALAVAAPVLTSSAHPDAAAAVYLGFSGVCHQIPARSFFIAGFPLAVCHRCAGIYLGLFLGALIANRGIHRTPAIRRAWVLAAIAPILVDVLASYLGIWSSMCLSRFLTGLLFGLPLSPLLVRGIEEFIAEAPWRRFACNPYPKGGLS